jgi:hypothetical protein
LDGSPDKQNKSGQGERDAKPEWFSLVHGKLDARNSPPGGLTRSTSQESNALGARRPSRVSKDKPGKEET